MNTKLTMHNDQISVAFQEGNVVTIYQKEVDNEKEYECLGENLNELHDTSIENAVHILQLHKTSKNIRSLRNIANATKRFLANINTYWKDGMKNNKERFTEIYATTVTWKTCKIIGSIKNKTCLQKCVNVDLALEYDMNTKLGRQCNFNKFHILHNRWIHILKQIFLENDFLNFLKKENIVRGLHISMSFHKWINKFKSVLFLNCKSFKKNIGTIKIILHPSKNVRRAFQKLCRTEERSLNSNSFFYQKNNSLKGENCKNSSNTTITSTTSTTTTNTDTTTASGTICLPKLTKGKKIKKWQSQQVSPSKRLLSFLLTECYIIRCENVVKRASKQFTHFNKAVKLLKLWCYHKRLLYVDSFDCERTNAWERKSHNRFSNFTYFGGINSFTLCILCCYVCYQQNLEKCDYLTIFKNTVQFISNIQMCDEFFNYENKTFETLKREFTKEKTGTIWEKTNVCDTSPVFLFDSLYEIFQNNKCSLVELIEEAKKAVYYINTSNYYKLFLEHNDCLQMNFEEEILFPFFYKKFFFYSDKKIAYIKKKLINGLGLRLEELTFRFVTFDWCKTKKRHSESDKNFQIHDKNDVMCNRERCKRGKHVAEQKKQITKMGVSFFLKTNDTVRYMDSAKCIYKMGRVSSFKKFWKHKAKVVRAKNNTICEVVNWKVPGKTRSRKKQLNKDYFLKTKNEVFDGLFSELYKNKTKSVHGQIINWVLSTLNFKECFHLNKCAYKIGRKNKQRINSLTNEILPLQKLNKNHSTSSSSSGSINSREMQKKENPKKKPFVYFSNPLLVKDMFYSYYKIIFEKFHEIKSILYGITDKECTITNITSSNPFFKMADLGLKKNKVEMIEIVVDINFEEFIFRDGQRYFTNYEIAKKIICNKLKEGSFSKIESKNFCIDVYADNKQKNSFIFRLHIITSFIFNKPLMRITNFQDVSITTVDQIEDIKNFIYKPLISSFIAVYSQKFASFHVALKLCKIWMMSKGFHSCDELVEHIVYYIFKTEYKKHIAMNNFFDKEDIPVQNKSLANFNHLYRHFYKEREKLRSQEGRSTQLSDTGGNNSAKVSHYDKNAPGAFSTQNNIPTNKSARKGKKRKRINEKKTQSKERKKIKKNKNNVPEDNAENKLVEEGEKYAGTFSISSKTILIKFLQFLTTFEWKQKPLIVDFDDRLEKSQANKIVNSFTIRKKNGEKKTFWIASIFDPHCILITLPHNMFYAIVSQASWTLQIVNKLYTNFEKEKWMTLFLMDSLTWDIRLNFNSPKQVFTNLKKQVKDIGRESEKKEKEKIEEDDENSKCEKKQEGKEEREKHQGTNTEETLSEEEIYDLSYTYNVKKEHIEIGDIIKKVNASEIVCIYKKYLEHFIMNIEQKYAFKLSILFNPICFENILHVTNFKNNIKRKLKAGMNLSKKKWDLGISWKNTMLLISNPFTLHSVRRGTVLCGNEDANDKINDVTFSVTNFNLLMYYIKANTQHLLKSVKLPHTI